MVSQNDHPAPGRRERLRIVSYLLNVVLGVICTLLVLQNRQLKSVGGGESASLLKPGTKAESFHFRDLGGKDSMFEYTSTQVRQLFFVFTTTCPHCQNSLAEVQHLVDLTIEKGDVNIVGISLDNPEQTLKYFTDNRLRFPLLSVGDDFIREYGTYSVPMFVLLKGDGTVIKTWRGELNTDSRGEILSLISEPKVAANENPN
jgi:peroxiredoxin